MTHETFSFRHPTIDDANQMWDLAKRSSLDTNSSYSYLMMAKFFNDRCYVVYDRQAEMVVGFVTGFVLKGDVYFVWQICIDPNYRGQGLAYSLLTHALKSMIAKEDVKFVQATVDPSNEASMNLFRRISKTYHTFFATKDGFEEDHFPDDKPEERLVQVGPLNIEY